MQKLLEQTKEVRAEVGELLFVKLGIPFSLFCFSISLFVFAAQRQYVKA